MNDSGYFKFSDLRPFAASATVKKEKPEGKPRGYRGLLKYTNEAIKKKAEALEVKVERFINSIPDRYGFLFIEVSAFGLCLSWLIVEMSIKWPTATAILNDENIMVLRVNNMSVHDAVYNTITYFYPYMEMCLSALGIASICFLTVKSIHHYAKKNYTQDINKITIEERQEDILNSVDDFNEEELIPFEDMDTEELLDISRLLILTSQSPE